ncbi:hypothetical protein Tco_0252683 [Tanacetum coccineum]
MTITSSGITPEAIEELINRRMKEAMAAYEEARAANALEAESQSQNGSDGDNRHGGNGNGGNGNPNENGRGVVELTRWFEKMETMFYISNCPEKYQVKELMKLMTELTMLCTKMVPEEEDRVERYIGGLPDNIQGNVIVAEPTRLQDAVRIANNLMDQKLKGYAVKNAENKRKLEVNLLASKILSRT